MSGQLTRIVGWALVAVLLLTSCSQTLPEPTSTTREATTPDPVAVSSTSSEPAVAPASTTIPPSWTYIGADGVETTISDASRIVVLNGDLNEIVYALGLGASVVGNDLSATYPPETLELPKIGYQRALNSEGILSLMPTLVIGNQQAGPPEVLEQVRSTGVPVVILADEVSLDGAARKVRMVGDVLGVRDRALELAERIEAEIVEAQGLIPERAHQPRLAFIYARGLGVMFMAGRGTPSESLIEAAGGVDAGAAAGAVDFVPLTAEGLAEADPEWLILTEDGLESIGGVDGLLDIPGVSQTSAGQAGRVLTFDDLGFLGLTPRVGAILRSLVSSVYVNG